MDPTQIVGLGAQYYAVHRHPFLLPDGICLDGISDVALFNGALIVLRRRSPQLIVLSLEGQFLRSVTLDQIITGHGLRALGSDLLAVTDVDGHQVVFLDRDLAIAHRLHCNNRPRLGHPFNHPSDCARDSKGRIYVADGYGNSNVHVFNPDMTFSHSFGGAGTADGAFSTPHSVEVLHGGRVAVADRENNRVQLFQPDGTYLSTITGLHKPMAMEAFGEYLYVTDQTPRLSVFDVTGTLVGRCRTFSTYGHGIARAGNGDIYIADMAPDGVTWLQALVT